MGRNAKRKKEERQKGRRPNRRRRKWVTRALLSLAIIAAIVAWQWKGPLWGYKTAPSFSLDASTGQLVSLRDYLGKQEIVIIFYMGASWGMCREQLVKLRPHVKELEAEGAAVLGMSMDTPTKASELASNLELTFPLVSDPNMEIVREYGMEGKAMGMPEMGYVVIDKQGHIRAQEIDRRFGENVREILGELRAAKSKT